MLTLTDLATQFGIWGIALGGVSYALSRVYNAYMRQNRETIEKLRGEVTELRQNMEKYMGEDRMRMVQVIEKNTHAFEQVTQVMQPH